MQTVPGDERFRLLVQSVQDYAIFMLDPDGWITTWNDGAVRIKGYAPEEVIGRHFSLFYPEADLQRGKPALELHVAAEAGRYEVYGWRVRKDGGHFWAHVVITTLRNDDGSIAGFARVTHDLTERRQEEVTLRRSEARLSGIISSAMDAIISINVEQRVVLFNRAAELIFKCPASDAIGRPLERFVPASYRHVHEKHIREFGETGVNSRSMSRPGTLTGLRASGEEFPIEATISQIETAGQKFFTVILRDVSQRMESERELEQALEAANTANRTKSEFLTMMSHELRTPLNAISGFAQLLALGVHGTLNDMQSEQVKRIQRSGTHLLTVINDILNFARLEGGHLEYDIRDIALRDIVDEVVPLMQPQMEAKRIAFDVGSVGADVSARADADKTRQILLNLLTNAVKFTGEGGRVAISCGVEGPNVAVNVTDSGPGIPDDKIETIFEPFVQLERKLTRTVEGDRAGSGDQPGIGPRHGGRSDRAQRGRPGIDVHPATSTSSVDRGGCCRSRQPDGLTYPALRSVKPPASEFPCRSMPR